MRTTLYHLNCASPGSIRLPCPGGALIIIVVIIYVVVVVIAMPSHGHCHFHGYGTMGSLRYWTRLPRAAGSEINPPSLKKPAATDHRINHHSGYVRVTAPQ